MMDSILTTKIDLLKRPTPSEQAEKSVYSNCNTDLYSAKSNVAYPGMVTNQEKQKEAYDLHLATPSDFFYLIRKSQIQNSNTTKKIQNPNTTKVQENKMK